MLLLLVVVVLLLLLLSSLLLLRRGAAVPEREQIFAGKSASVHKDSSMEVPDGPGGASAGRSGGRDILIVREIL